LGDVLAAKAHEKGIELAFIVERDVPGRVKGDPSRLRQVLVNLLGNAIKYTSEGHVFARVSFAEMAEDSLKLRFDVVDSGIGIARAKMHHLFETFGHSDASSSIQFSGAGLGLAICKRLVEVMGGEIRCTSEVGRGTTFSFTVTLAHAEDKSDTEQLRRSQLLQGRRIFIVDSSEVGRAAIRETLLQWGCEVFEAASGKEVFEAVHGHQSGPVCHVALVSSCIADGDSIMFGKKFRAHPALRGVPMILLSLDGQTWPSSSSVDEIFTSTLVKPIRQKHLFNAIAGVIGIKPSSEESRVMKTPRHHLERIAKQQLFRILVVEDNLVNQRVAVRMIERLGYGCEVALNGLEALERIQENQYDLVFMDCQMPEMDGFTATTHIRTMEGGQIDQRLPIIAMTALVMEGDRERCLAVGMDDYITKPLKLEEVREKLIQYLPAKDLEDASYLLQ
jgi:CheY-like chemotaxis protein